MAHGVGEGSIGKVELAILVGHLFDAMPEPVYALQLTMACFSIPLVHSWVVWCGS